MLEAEVDPSHRQFFKAVHSITAMQPLFSYAFSGHYAVSPNFF